MKNSRNQGFTLIEIAIVLVIIGLLLGGILKGQELITSARVRNLIGQQDGIKAAFFGFQDRYRALPGDYSQASNSIQNINTTFPNGDGNGQISGTQEPILAWEHLARSGFINGNYTYSATLAETNTPRNPYGQYLQLIWDANYVVAGTAINRHNLKTGSQIPVEIIAEVDRKIDDGIPNTGSLVFSDYNGGGTPLVAPGAPPACMAAPPSPGAGSNWNLTGGTTAVTCGAATLM